MKRFDIYIFFNNITKGLNKKDILQLLCFVVHVIPIHNIVKTLHYYIFFSLYTRVQQMGEHRAFPKEF